MRVVKFCLLLAAAAVLAGAQHDDEFAGAGAALEDIPADAPQTATSTPPPAALKPLGQRLAQKDWSLEALSGVLLLIYIGVYVWGKRSNGAIAHAFAEQVRPLLREQFAQTGIGADDPRSGPFRKQSDAAWEMWSSGRRNCQGALASLALQPRQDLVGTLLAMLAPQLSPTPLADVLTLEIPIATEAPAPRFVFAIVPSKTRKAVLEAHGDLMKFPRKVTAGRAAGLPEQFDVLTESNDVTEAVLTAGGWKRLITQHPRVLRQLHYTDMAGMAGFPTASLGTKCLRVELNLPPVGEWNSKLLPFIQQTLSFIDELAAMKLSKEAAAKVAEGRLAFQRELDKEAQREQEEANRKAREEKKKQEQDRLANLDRDKRRKIEEKQRKEAMSKMMPKMKFKAV